jgi:osmotically-inducible protein OsmY
VTNRIKVTTQPITPQEIQRLIQEALERHTPRDAESIRVEVDEGKVTLSGRVSSWQEKRTIIEVVSHARGVEVVYDCLYVGPAE